MARTRSWSVRGRVLVFPERVAGVAAIVNVTPDSFSDGGRYLAPGAERASVSVITRHAARWVEAGALVLDVGGESTRPGSDPTAPEVERSRVLPVLSALRSDEVAGRAVLSIDTRHASTAEAAAEVGVHVVNDVSGLADPAMAEVVARHGLGLIIGHMRGVPKTMQQDITFDDLLGEIAGELSRSVDLAMAAGVSREAILVDPCIGFGKDLEQSAALVESADFLTRATGCPVMIGASRKRFLGEISGLDAGQRTLPSVVAAVLAARAGAALVRVHDVEETLVALAVADAVGAAASRAAARHGVVTGADGDNGPDGDHDG